MRDEKRKRKSDIQEKSERGLEVVSGRGGIHLYILDVVYIPFSLAYLSLHVFSFDFPSSGGPTPPFSTQSDVEGFGSSGHLFFLDPASRAVQTIG